MLASPPALTPGPFGELQQHVPGYRAIPEGHEVDLSWRFETNNHYW